MERGDKFKLDNGKLMWDLLPLKLVEPVVAVLTYGAKKYKPHSWRRVRNGKQRYWAALMRHLVDYQNGEILDKESGLPHLWHAACNIVFLMAFTDNECRSKMLLSRMDDTTEAFLGSPKQQKEVKPVGVPVCYNHKGTEPECGAGCIWTTTCKSKED
jgi:hypothetical protein